MLHLLPYPFVCVFKLQYWRNQTKTVLIAQFFQNVFPVSDSIQVNPLNENERWQFQQGIIFWPVNYSNIARFSDCTSTYTKYWPPSTSWRLCQCHMAIDKG